MNPLKIICFLKGHKFTDYPIVITIVAGCLVGMECFGFTYKCCRCGKRLIDNCSSVFIERDL